VRTDCCPDLARKHYRLRNYVHRVRTQYRAAESDCFSAQLGAWAQGMGSRFCEDVSWSGHVMISCCQGGVCHSIEKYQSYGLVFLRDYC